jgi:hypothetical protein
LLPLAEYLTIWAMFMLAGRSRAAVAEFCGEFLATRKEAVQAEQLHQVHDGVFRFNFSATGWRFAN